MKSSKETVFKNNKNKNTHRFGEVLKGIQNEPYG